MDDAARAAIDANPYIVAMMPLLLDFSITTPDRIPAGGYDEALFDIDRGLAGWVAAPGALGALEWLYGVERAAAKADRDFAGRKRILAVLEGE